MATNSNGQRSLVGYSPWGRRVRHNWAHTYPIYSKDVMRKGRSPWECLLLSSFGPKRQNSISKGDLGDFTVPRVCPDGLAHCWSGPSLPPWTASWASNPSLILRLSKPEKGAGTPLSREQLWVGPCLLDSFQLLGRVFSCKSGLGVGRSKLLSPTCGSTFIHLPTQAAACRINTSLLSSRDFRQSGPLLMRPI